jgi:hypothetical protein
LILYGLTVRPKPCPICPGLTFNRIENGRGANRPGVFVVDMAAGCEAEAQGVQVGDRVHNIQGDHVLMAWAPRVVRDKVPSDASALTAAPSIALFSRVASWLGGRHGVQFSEKICSLFSRDEETQCNRKF